MFFSLLKEKKMHLKHCSWCKFIMLILTAVLAARLLMTAVKSRPCACSNTDQQRGKRHRSVRRAEIHRMKHSSLFAFCFQTSCFLNAITVCSDS